MTAILNWFSLVFNDPLAMCVLALVIICVYYAVKAMVYTIVDSIRDRRRERDLQSWRRQQIREEQ